MLNLELLKPEIQNYINDHLSVDAVQLMFQPSPFPGIEMSELAEQIQGKQKCRQKLPEWYSTPGIYYPPSRALEQCSSSGTAAYKTWLAEGDTLADLTGGAGVDSYFFAKVFKQVFYLERARLLTKIAAHNLPLLGEDNIRFLSGDGMQLVHRLGQKLDCIYLDPSRRTRDNKKVFLPRDYEPDFMPHLQGLTQLARRVLIKTSPLIDIHFGINAFRYVRAVHIVSVRNECKEIVWVLGREPDPDPTITCVNLHRGDQMLFQTDPPFTYRLSEETDAPPAKLSEPLDFLFEPNASILKSGAFKTVGRRFSLPKLHANSHLYTYDFPVPRFPGRTFKILEQFTVREFGKRFKNQRVHVSTRNFPERAPAIMKKYGLTAGGDDYAFFTTNPAGKRVVLWCRKPEDLAKEIARQPD